MERKLSYRRRQQKKLRRRSVQNGQAKGGGGSGAEPVLQDVTDEQTDRAQGKGQCSRLEPFATVPLRTSPDSVDEVEGRGRDVQSVLKSPISPEESLSFSATLSEDLGYFRPDPDDDSLDPFRSELLLGKSASSRRRAFQRSTGSGAKQLSITVQGTSFSDGDPPTDHARHHGGTPLPTAPSQYSGCEDSRCLTPCECGRSLREPHQHRRANPSEDCQRANPSEDCRRAKHPEDRNSVKEREPSPCPSWKSSGHRDASPSRTRKMHRSSSVNPAGIKRTGHGSDSTAQAESRQRSSYGGAVSPTCSGNTAVSEAVSTTGWHDPSFRRSLSPSIMTNAKGEDSVNPPGCRRMRKQKSVSPAGSRRARREDSISPSSSRPMGREKSVSPSGARRMSEEDRVSPSNSRRLSKEDSISPSSSRRIRREKSVSPSGSRRMSKEDSVSPSGSRKSSLRKRRGDGVSRGRNQSVGAGPQTCRSRENSVESKTSTLRERSCSEGNGRGGGGGEKEEAGTLQETSNVHANVGPHRLGLGTARNDQNARPHAQEHALSYSCATHALRRVKSPDADVTQTEPRDTSTCRCWAWEGRVEGFSTEGGRREGGRSASPRESLRVSGLDAWSDGDTQLVHTVLHKPPHSFPGKSL